MKVFLTLILAFLLTLSLSAQDKKKYTITRTDAAPKIDGVLNEEVWKTAQIATDFVQFEPTVGKTMPENKRTEVKMTYDDTGIYIAAYLYDTPEDMMKQFTQRDDFGQSDFFLDPSEFPAARMLLWLPFLQLKPVAKTSIALPGPSACPILSPSRFICSFH